MVRKGFSEDGTLKLKPEGLKGARCSESWREASALGLGYGKGEERDRTGLGKSVEATGTGGQW